MKVAFAAILCAAGTVVGLSGTADDMKSLVRDKSPAELNSLNEKKLRQMGVPDPLTKVFLKNPNCGPQEETILVGELSSMTGVKDIARFISAASLANEESVALFMRLRAQLIALYHSKGKTVAGLVEANQGSLCEDKRLDSGWDLSARSCGLDIDPGSEGKGHIRGYTKNARGERERMMDYRHR